MYDRRMNTRKKRFLVTLTMSVLVGGCNLFLDLAPIPNSTDRDLGDAQIDLDAEHDMAPDLAQDMVADTSQDTPSDLTSDLVQDMTADLAEDLTADMPQEMGPAVRSIGPRPVAATPLASGTLFAAPNGVGNACSQSNPCSVYQAASRAIASDVVFLRGGIYRITQTLNLRGGNPSIVFESYPNEEAILDGSSLTSSDFIYILIAGAPITLRRLTVQNMPQEGITVNSSDHIFEGLTLRGNLLGGIRLDGSPAPSRNIIRDSVVSNSGRGGKADGIAISIGSSNRVENCLVHDNSDDGIDIWQSVDTYVAYSIMHNNGGPDTDGQGIRAGGSAPGARAVVEHNLSYSNKTDGFDFNGGTAVTFRNNTSWDNAQGFQLGSDTLTTKNIAFDVAAQSGSGVQLDNSWQRVGSPSPLSTDPSSPNFLVPSGTGFSNIGAHADRQ